VGAARGCGNDKQQGTKRSLAVASCLLRCEVAGRRQQQHQQQQQQQQKKKKKKKRQPRRPPKKKQRRMKTTPSMAMEARKRNVAGEEETRLDGRSPLKLQRARHRR
jgi:hypothetical protein